MCAISKCTESPAPSAQHRCCLAHFSIFIFFLIVIQAYNCRDQELFNLLLVTGHETHRYQKKFEKILRAKTMVCSKRREKVFACTPNTKWVITIELKLLDFDKLCSSSMSHGEYTGP